ncbi:MAG: T9SS type A sorting domain-containing protein [Chitinophagales bacterium]|nr:T9SS type A sorting domain-containing protein [Chitinophagales bacterium]
MNRLYLLFAAFLGNLSLLNAQMVAIDSSFSEDGYHITLIQPSKMYHHPMDVFSNGNIVVGGNAPITSNVKVNIYSEGGDSLATIGPFPGEEPYSGVGVVKVLPSGKFLCANGISTLRRYHPDGTLDSTFGDNGYCSLKKVQVVDLAIRPDGGIYGIGRYGPVDTSAIVAFLENGVPDSSFSEDGLQLYCQSNLEIFYCIELQADGKLLISGFSFFAQKDRPGSLIRFLPNGQLDSTFGINGRVLEYLTQQSEGYALGVQSDQKIVVGGYTLPPYMATVVRYLPNGDRDPEFGDSGVVYLPIGLEVLDLIIQPDGKLLLYVWANIHSNSTGALLIQLNPDGSMDQTFGAGGVYYSNLTPVEPPFALAKSGNNKIVTVATSPFAPSSPQFLHIQQFILDFNVGVLQPNNALDEAQMLVYPNPVSQNIQFQFELQTPETLDIQLLDLSGKILQTVHQHQLFEAGKQEISIPVSDALPAGTYLLNISGQGKVIRSVRWVKG